MTFSSSASPVKRQQAVSKLIAELNQDARPILLGPYRSELGFECLYWLPFLRFLSSQIKDFARRASVVTRGGLAPLYADVAAQGYDLYALRDVKDVRRENLYDLQARQKGKTIKQVLMTDWDEAVLEDAARALSITGVFHVVHPSWMYWALAPYWEEEAGLKYLLSLAHYATLPKIGSVVQGGLPPKYVAVKFYARHTFPYPHPEVAEFVTKLVGRLAAQVPVVMLSTGQHHDDHADIPIAPAQNIHVLPSDLAPEVNLQVQAAVIGHANAYVGTYGGVSQLALRLGVPSVSFYADWGGTAHGHLALSSWLSKQTKVPFMVGSMADAQVWKQVMTAPEKKQAVAA